MPSSRGIYPQGLNLGLPCCRRILNDLSHKGIIHLLSSSFHFFHKEPGSWLKHPARLWKWPRETAAPYLQTLGQTAWLFFWFSLSLFWNNSGKSSNHMEQECNTSWTLIWNSAKVQWGSESKVEGFPSGSVKESACQSMRHRFNPWGSHMPHSNWARVPQLLSLCSRAQEATG